MKVLASQQASIGRNQIAGRQSHDVARYDLAARQFEPLSVALDSRRGRHLIPEALHRSFRSVGLDKIEHDAHHDHHRDDDCIDHLTQKRRDRARDQQYQDKWIGAETQELKERPGYLRRDRFVGPELSEALFRLCTGEARFGLDRSQRVYLSPPEHELFDPRAPPSQSRLPTALVA